MQHAYNHFGSNNLVFAIIEIVKYKTELLNREQFWIDYYDPEYNLCEEAHAPYGCIRSVETRMKISKSLTGRPGTRLGMKAKESTKRKISEYVKAHPISYWKGKKRYPETLAKVSKSLKGKIPWNKGKKGLYHATDETKKKISLSQKGKNFTRGFFKGMVAWNKGLHTGIPPWNKGKKASPESLIKQGISMKKAWERKGHSHWRNN